MPRNSSVGPFVLQKSFSTGPIMLWPSGPAARSTWRLRFPSGHVFRLERVRGPVRYAKYRLPDGRQVQKAIEPLP